MLSDVIMVDSEVRSVCSAHTDVVRTGNGNETSAQSAGTKVEDAAIPNYLLILLPVKVVPIVNLVNELNI